MGSGALSSRELAKQSSVAGVTVSHQNIENILAGKQTACRPKLRDALARVLELPSSEWLGDEQDLPELPWWEAPRTLGVDGVTGVDLNQRALPRTRWYDTLEEARRFFRLPAVQRVMPPRYQLLAWRLARDLEGAWARSCGVEPEAADYPATFTESENAAQRRVQAGWTPLYALPAVSAVLSLSFWRRAAMAEPYGGLVDEEEMDRFAAGMEQAIRTLLRPWLGGMMDLRAPDDLETLFAKLADLGKTLARVESRDQVRRQQELLRHHEQSGNRG
jgi:hypothetical protein